MSAIVAGRRELATRHRSRGVIRAQALCPRTPGTEWRRDVASAVAIVPGKTSRERQWRLAGGAGGARGVAPAGSSSSTVASLAMFPAFQLAGHLWLMPASA